MAMKKIKVVGSFNDVKDRLITKMKLRDFTIAGELSYDDKLAGKSDAHFRRHTVLAVDCFKLSSQIAALGNDIADDIMPCLVSIVEVYPGRLELALYNPNHKMAEEAGNPFLEKLTHQMNLLIEEMLHSVGSNVERAPDLVTSWS